MIVLLVLFSAMVMADASEIYKKGVVRLEFDSAYGQGTDWPALFGKEASRLFEGQKLLGELFMTVAPNGMTFVSNTANFLICQFDANGRLVRKIQNPENIPPDSSSLNRRPEYLTILDGRWLLVCEGQGRINVFDLEGNRQKLLRYDYIVKSCTALASGKIAILGGVGMKGSMWKNRVAIQDFPSGIEKEIFSVKEDLSRIILVAKTATNSKQASEFMVGSSTEFSGQRLFIRPTASGGLLIAEWRRPEVKFFSPTGEDRVAFRLNDPQQVFPESKKQEYIDKLKKSVTINPEVGEKMLADLETKPDFFPKTLPFFSEIMVDAEGNILVFSFREDEKLIFQVYSPDGKYMNQCELHTGDYFFPQGLRQRFIAFQGKYIYALMAPKGKPEAIRLIKARLTAK